MLIIPVVVFMLSLICKPDEGASVGNFAKHYSLITFFVALQVTTFVGGICQAAMCNNDCILVGSIFLLVTVGQFFCIAGCVKHDNGAFFTNVGSKRIFLFGTTLSTICLTMSVWNVGWSGYYNVFFFTLCFSLALLTIVTLLATEHSNAWTSFFVVCLAASILTFGTGFLSVGGTNNCNGWAIGLPMFFGVAGIVICVVVLFKRQLNGDCACCGEQNDNKGLLWRPPT